MDALSLNTKMKDACKDLEALLNASNQIEHIAGELRLISNPKFDSARFKNKIYQAICPIIDEEIKQIQSPFTYTPRPK